MWHIVFFIGWIVGFFVKRSMTLPTYRQTVNGVRESEPAIISCDTEKIRNREVMTSFLFVFSIAVSVLRPQSLDVMFTVNISLFVH